MSLILFSFEILFILVDSDLLIVFILHKSEYNTNLCVRCILHCFPTTKMVGSKDERTVFYILA